MQRETIANIQMLRALAAILVVLHHALPHYTAMGGDLSWVKHISEWGFFGVDIFFVISGYIMAYTTFDKPRTVKSAKTFLKHRFFRIYLGYWPFFFVMLFALLYTKKELGSYDLWGSFFLTNDNMFELVLPVSWSLSYELYFYLIFTLTLLLPVRILYAVVPLLFAALLGISYYIYTHPPLVASFFYSHFLLEFFAGVLLFIHRQILMRYQVILPTVIIAVIAYSTGIMYETKNGLPRIMTFGTGAVMVVLTALIIEAKRQWKAPRFLVSLGDASYTLYLSHLILLELFYHFGLRDLFASQSNILLPFLGLISIFTLCIVFSLYYYHYIEKPVYRKAIHS